MYLIKAKSYGEELNRQRGMLFMFMGAAIVGATSARPHFAFRVRSTIELLLCQVID